MRGQRWEWSGDRDRFIANLPAPIFRQRDAYDTADKMGITRWRATGIWHRLVIEGRIVRTEQRIGKAIARCYWERSHCSIRVTDANRQLLTVLTRRR